MAEFIDPFSFWIRCGDHPAAHMPPMNAWLKSDRIIAHAQRAVARHFNLDAEPQLHLWLDASPVTGQHQGLAVFGDGRRFYTYKWHPDGQIETSASDDWPLAMIEWPGVAKGSQTDRQ